MVNRKERKKKKKNFRTADLTAGVRVVEPPRNSLADRSMQFLFSPR
jgi:hypothetical protein